jgi:hypothetical protein
MDIENGSACRCTPILYYYAILPIAKKEIIQ